MTSKRWRRKGNRVGKGDYAQKRRAYRAYSDGQRADAGKQSGRRLAEKVEKTDGRSWQLVVSAVILVSVIAVKLIAPQALDQVRGDLLHLMGADTDFVEVFSSVGKVVGESNSWEEKLREVLVAVFGADNGTDEVKAKDEKLYYTTENIPDDAYLGQKMLGISHQKPVAGSISDKFGYRIHPIDSSGQFHYGIDLQADEGEVITSFAAGEVTAVGESATLGKYITVQHDGGYQTLYAHCSRVTASSGQQVQMGDPIAEVGQTGQTTGPHLHFELLLDSLYLNPVYYVAE